MTLTTEQKAKLAEILNGVQLKDSKDEAFEQMSGDVIFNFGGKWGCFSDNDPIVKTLCDAGFKTELQEYFERTK